MKLSLGNHPGKITEQLAVVAELAELSAFRDMSRRTILDSSGTLRGIPFLQALDLCRSWERSETGDQLRGHGSSCAGRAMGDLASQSFPQLPSRFMTVDQNERKDRLFRIGKDAIGGAW